MTPKVRTRREWTFVSVRFCVASESGRLPDVASILNSPTEARVSPPSFAALYPRVLEGHAICRNQCSALAGWPATVPRSSFSLAECSASLAECSAVAAENRASVTRTAPRNARSVATDAQPTALGIPFSGEQLSGEQIAAD
jgi:hypothetical protein